MWSVKKRRRWFVEPRVQGAFMLRAALYWFSCMICLTSLTSIWNSITRQADFFGFQLPGGLPLWVIPPLASLLFLPMVMYDMVRLSNRLVGPILRLRSAMRGVAQGRPAPAIAFREGDFWRDFAGEFNAVADRVAMLERALRAAEARLRERPDTVIDEPAFAAGSAHEQ